METNYLYHQLPEDMEGDILYPLNELKEVYPEIYEKQVKKYQDREHLLDEVIPILRCRWNDVLHFSPVHPKEIQKVFEKINHEFHGKFLEIDSKLLDLDKTVLYLYFTDGPGLNPKEIIRFNPNELGKYSELRYETKKYYKEEYLTSERPLLFYKIPHILFKGSLDIDDATVIEV